jgi:hypothetical protein
VVTHVSKNFASKSSREYQALFSLN